jgi:hypothetical protein
MRACVQPILPPPLLPSTGRAGLKVMALDAAQPFDREAWMKAKVSEQRKQDKTLTIGED